MSEPFIIKRCIKGDQIHTQKNAQKKSSVCSLSTTVYYTIKLLWVHVYKTKHIKYTCHQYPASKESIPSYMIFL